MKLLAIALVIAMPAAAGAQQINADRPGLADGSSVVARGIVQIEIGFQRESHDDDGIKSRASFLPTLVRVGLARNLEARVETNAYSRVTTTDASGTGHASGWTPASVGFKYRFLDGGDTSQPSIGTIVRVFPASGSRDFATTRLTADVRFVADMALSDTLSLNPNIGVARYEGDAGTTFTAALLAVTLSYSPTLRFNPFIDAGYQGPSGPGGRGSLVIDAGLGYIVGRNVQLDVSAGTRAHGPGPRPFIAFGVSVRSGR